MDCGPTPTSWYPLICTVDVPARIINKIITVERPCGCQDPSSGFVMHETVCFGPTVNTNFWVLMSKRDTSDWVYGLKHATNTVESDFKGATVEELGRFCRQAFRNHTDPANWKVAPHLFGVLDARSLEDDTMLLVQDDYDYAPDSPPPSSPLPPKWVKAFVRTRINFMGASDFFTVFTYKGLHDLYHEGVKEDEILRPITPQGEFEDGHPNFAASEDIHVKI